MPVFSTLLSHQKDALSYANKIEHPAFFMEMRLGKTKVVIEYLKSKSYVKRILVIAPLTTLVSWIEELNLENIKDDIIILSQQYRNLYYLYTHSYRWVLINYEGIRSNPDIASGIDWDAIVLDESTKIKNPKAKITKFLIKNFRNVYHRIIMSGRPAPESPLNFVEQFRFLHGKFLGFNNYWRLRIALFYLNYKGFGWEPKNKTRGKIKLEVNKLGFVLSRKDVNLGNKRIYEKRYIDMIPKQKHLYDKAEKEFSAKIDGKEKFTKWVITKYIWMGR